MEALLSSPRALFSVTPQTPSSSRDTAFYLDEHYLSVGHPPFYKGLDYIYEDRGEVLDIRIFETGEYALIAWVGIPTPPAWLPTYMLIKSDKLDYERI
uniref:Uncharacterized protein n=1 Tax=Oryza brachyantha TaxID=4533 RepID=J3L823_ORYBR